MAHKKAIVQVGSCEAICWDTARLYQATEAVLLGLTTRTQFETIFERVQAVYGPDANTDLIRDYVHKRTGFEVLRGQYGGVQVTGGYEADKPVKPPTKKELKAAEAAAALAALKAAAEAAPALVEVPAEVVAEGLPADMPVAMVDAGDGVDPSFWSSLNAEISNS